MAGLRDSLTRDLVALHKGDSFTVKIYDGVATGNVVNMRDAWDGGQFVRWFDDGSGDLTVTLANGVYCGFTPFGSAELGDKFTSISDSDITYDKVVMYFGGNIFYTRTYETETYVSRNGLGPFAALTYTANQSLYVSENGKITNEDESDLAINPTGNFPDGTPITVPFVFFGVCAVPPSTATNNYIGVQTNFGV